MNNDSLKNRQQGMTLVEIMVALVLGIFLLAGVIEIFIGSNQSYRMLDNLSRMQENGRFAMDFISRDIREAGNREACFERSIPTAITGTNDAGLNSSDTITTQVSTAVCPASAATALTVVNTVYSIWDSCFPTSPCTPDPNPEPALFRSIGGNNQELVEGIEDMQILYGEDTDADNTPNYYVAAGTAGLAMNQVVSIRITLTVRSLDSSLTTTGDGRLRRTFSSTIAVRNRLP